MPNTTKTTRSHTKSRISLMVQIVDSILQRQQAEPGYKQDILESLVAAELRNLEAASGVSLDAVVAGQILRG